MNINVQTMTPHEKHVLWVMGRIDLLIEHELMSGTTPLSVPGRAAFDQLIASGHTTHEFDVRAVLAALARTRFPQLHEMEQGDLEAIIKLIAHWTPPEVPTNV